MLSQNPKLMVSRTFLLLLLCVAFLCASDLVIAAPSSSASPSEDLTVSALLALKASISSDPTGLFASWNTSSHFCTWQGILCSNNSQQVKGLLINSKNLNGTLPPQIADLQGLSYLNVSNNSFYGPVPTQLGSLAFTLTHLDLSANEFTGRIPTSLARCTLLRYIDLNSNFLTSQFPSYVTNFTLLGYLDLSSNSITGELPPDMGLLSSLQFLQVYATGLTGTIPTSLMNCSNLVWLDLADNLLSGPLPSDWTKLASTLQQVKLMGNHFSGRIPLSLANCTLLTVFNLQNNSLTGEIPQSIGQLTLLQELKLYMNYLSGPFPPSTMNCTLLVFLEVSNNNLSGVIPQDVGRLTRAEWITFSGNPLIEGTIPDSIGGCAQLQVLSLYGSALGGSLPTSLFILTNLQQLNLRDCAFSGSLPPAGMGQLTSLQTLTLSNNAFEGSIPAQLGELQNLQGLFIQDNSFSGSIPPELSGCVSLADMNLSFNPLSGSIPPSFAQLRALSNLYIRGTHLSGAIPDIFARLTRLQSLDLAYNMLTGSIPVSLAKLDTLNVLLDLSFNNLTGAIPSSIGGMQMLVTMILSGNTFTGEIPTALGDCQGMQVLDLSMNKLEGEIPDSLGQMKSLQHLDLSHNELSGALPSSVGLLVDLVYLNVSYNALEGLIPRLRVYENSSSFFFSGNPRLCGYPSSTNCDSHSTSSHSKRVAIIISVCVAGGAILSAILCACLWWWCRGEDEKASASEDVEAEDSEVDFFDMETPRIKAWTAKEVRAATNDFDAASVLGSGGVSVCYRAVMEESSKGSKKSNVVAIKRLNVGDYHGGEARRSFVNELKTICKMRHRNLVKVLGYCVEGGEVALVMEYMEEGDLDGHLHGKAGGLDWDERLNVAIDVAEGLVYLHHEYVHPIVHCDLKPKNILLGSDMVAKISDFGIAKLLDLNQAGDMSTSKFRGSFGYAAPEYATGSRISTKVDVYSYGVLLLELVTGVMPTSQRLQKEGVSLQTWARGLQESGRTKEALDTKLNKDILHEAEEVLGLGVKCSVEVAKDRPSMQTVRDSVMRIKRQRLLKKGGKNSFPNIEELLQAPDHSLSLPEANILLLNPSIQVDCSGLESLSSPSTSK